MSFFLNSYFINLTASSIPIIYYDLIYDQYWDNTVLLLHGDKSIVDDRVIDNSLSALPITRFGETPKNVLSPFGILGESIDFRQTSNYLTVSGGNWFNFGSSNFTIECWFYATTNSAGYAGIFVKGSSDPGRYTFNMSPAENTAQFWVNKWGVSGPICGSSTVITDGVWHHLAAVRNNNVFTFYVDGVAGSVTNTWTGSIDDSLVDPYIGVDPFSFTRELNAIISNLRITKGAALYTSNFTPPTSPLTLTSNGGATPSTLPTSSQVSLLLLNNTQSTQNNTFLDSSTNNFTITRNGTPTQGSFSPFALSAAPYYPSVNLGSGYFNGSTDFLSTPWNTSLNFASGDFTFETFVNPTLRGQILVIAGICDGLSTVPQSWWCFLDSNGFFYFVVDISTSDTIIFTSSNAIPINAWTHIAVTREGSTYRLFINGVLNQTTVNAGAVSAGSAQFRIGSFQNMVNPYKTFNGYISNLRIVKGTALYVSNFTRPSSPVTTTSNGGATPSTLPTPSQVSFLCNFADAGIYDSTEKNNLITVGNASISASQVKYGTGAIYFDGAGDELTIVSPNSSLDLGTSDFTFEMWVKFNSQTDQMLYNRCNQFSGTGSSIGWFLRHSNTGKNILFGYGNDSPSNYLASNSNLLSYDSWNHIAATRIGNTLSIYINGNLAGIKVTLNGQNNHDKAGFSATIGSYGGFFYLNGYIDDFRITKGVARYTSNFTPPSRAVPDIPYLGVFALQIDTTKTGTTTNTQFNLALRSSTSYDFDIDWGDNVTETYTSSNTTGYNHTYPAAGIYTVTIVERSLGGFPGVFYNGSGDRQKILNLAQFGGNQFGTNWSFAFLNCVNLKIPATDFLTAKTQNVTNFNGTWQGCSSLTSFPLIDTSRGQNFQSAWLNCSNANFKTFPAINTLCATNFYATWNNCQGLTNFPYISTNNVTSFRETWTSCINLTSFPLINTSNGTNFSAAWQNCTSLTSFPLIDTSKGTNFSSAWDSCNKLTSFPLINTSNATSLQGTWQYCTSLTSFPFLNTSNVVDFGSAFINCPIKSFPLFDTSKCTNFSSMLYGTKIVDAPLLNTLSGINFNAFLGNCKELTGVPLFDLSNATDVSALFYLSNKLNSIPLFNTSKAINFRFFTSDCTSLTSFPLIDTSKGTNFEWAWQNCNKLASFPLINTSNGTNFSAAWQNCTSLTSFPLIDTSKGTNFSSAWYSCNKLTSFPVISTLSGTNFSSAWSLCTSLTSFPLINTSNGTNFSYAWSSCYSLTSFPLINTSNGTNFEQAWYDCNKLTSFPLITTSKVTIFKDTWSRCSSLSSFPLIDTLSGTNFTSTWQNCISLSASDFPTLNMSKMTNGTNCFAGVKLTTTSYSALLTSLCATNFNTGVVFHGGNSTFNTAGSAAKVFLTTSTGTGGRGWTITDGGYQAGT